jgi:uracil-DNA glycosylase
MRMVERADQSVSPAEALSALQWWADAGVDVLVDEAPRDWLRPKTEAPPRRVEPEVAEPTEVLPNQLQLFRAWLADDQDLPYAAPAAPRVCPAGDPASGLMMITDMPAAEDCSSGILLSGDAGTLFDRMLAAIGRDRSNIYLASISCLRSPSGSFTDPGASRCATLARHHLGLAAPKAVLLLGDTCCKALLGMAVMQARGRWHGIATHVGEIPALASFHPSYLLDQPGAKKHAWADLQMLMEKFEQ